MPPRNGACFFHDLDWERYQSKPTTLDASASTLVAVEETKTQVADRGLTSCFAAAKQYELKQHVEAIQAAIQSKLAQFPTIASTLVASYCRSKKMFYTFIENRNLKLVNAAVAPESLPVTALVTAAESNYVDDWNCGDWCQGYSRSRTVSLPSREVANIFIYTLDTSTTPRIDSSFPVATSDAAKSEIVDSRSMAYSEYIGDNLLTEAEICQWNSAIAAEISHPWQVGIDPVCSEVQSTELAAQSLSNLESRSVCCPVEDSAEAVSQVANVDNANVNGTRVAGVEVAEGLVNDPVAGFAARPPILEAEIEFDDSNPGIEFEGRRPVHCLISDFDAGTFASDRYNHLFGDYDYAHPLLGSVNAPRWLNNHVKRFAFGDNSPRMPIAQPPVAAFSKEDLQFDNRFSSNLLGNSPSQVNETQIEAPNEQENESVRFLSKDFLTSLQTSAYGSIVLPVNQTKHMALDYAMQLIPQTSSPSQTHASRKFASQLRTIGQFLVDFATQIENRAEQVEIARGDNKRLESNQR